MASNSNPVKQAHTPGPWQAEEEPYGIDIVVRDEEKTLAVAEVPGVSDREDYGISDEDRFNARLIAAAPELLEALKELENDDNSIPQWLWLRIKQAIAKAEGL